MATPKRGLKTRIQHVGTQLPIAIGAGLLVLVVTQWIVAALATGALVLMWDTLFGGSSSERRSIAKIEETLSDNARSFEAALEGTRGGLETALSNQGAALVDLITNRVEQANEAFTIAGESLGTLITDRTREASAGLKTEIDDLGLALARQATEATERLANTGRDVLQAMNQHGQRVNEALAANASRLAETVTARTAGLGERFEEFGLRECLGN